MLRRDEIAHWAGIFGVADDQIRRDYLVSHVLAGIAGLGDEGLVFFGGTALARTHLPRFRLSEDVDLLVGRRAEWASRLERHLPRALHRLFGPTHWRPGPTGVPAVAPAVLVAGELRVRLQLTHLDAEQSRWPVERRPLEMRYGDVPATAMTVPTLAAFAAMKTIAWMDRGATRDLADLAALADLGALTADGALLVKDMAGWRPMPDLFKELPLGTVDRWHTDLDHQMADPLHPWRCLATVREAWAAALGQA